MTTIALMPQRPPYVQFEQRAVHGKGRLNFNPEASLLFLRIPQEALRYAARTE